MKLDLPLVPALVVSAISISLSVVVSCHVVLHKRDSRSATGWAALVWLSPFVGSLLYYLLGVNRIGRRASQLGLGENAAGSGAASEGQRKDGASGPALVAGPGRLGLLPLVEGNSLEPLWGGAQAYPAMMEALESARRSIALQSYIFDRGPSGDRFVEALGRAVERGVRVRVLIDAFGAKTSRAPVVSELRRRAVRCALFLPTRFPLRLGSPNLRNHRKLLLIDDELAFTGGMNFREGNLLEEGSKAIRDLQFRVRGPVVQQLRGVFEQDWAFASDEGNEPQEPEEPGGGFGPSLASGASAPPSSSGFPTRGPAAGPVRARAIPDGPDEAIDRLRYTLMAGIARARRSIRVMTPYFLPDRPLIAALNVAALRGVRVDVLVPANGNLPFVEWASTATLWQVLEFGCRIWSSPGIFDHSKLMVVDEEWSLIGSANWDPRSLRLNFELCVECEDRGLGEQLAAAFDARREGAREITLEEVDGRPLGVRLRDGFARLLTPYL